MSKLPFMKFYVDDYLADTKRLKTIEHGAYFLLLCEYWRDQASLVNDDEELADICGMGVEEFQKIKPKLLKYFKEKNGRLIHNKVERVLKESKAAHKKRSDAGRLGGKAKPKQCLSNGQAKPKQPEPEPEPELKEESKVKNNTKKPKRASSISKDWKPSQEFVDHCEAKYPLVDSLLELEKFKDHWISNGDTKKDWLAAWRNWLRNGFNPIMKGGGPNRPAGGKQNAQDMFEDTNRFAEQLDRERFNK